MDKVPPIVKVLFGAAAVILLLYTFVGSSYKANKNKKVFYEAAFSSTIVSSSMYEGRSVEFILANGIRIYLMPPLVGKAMIGDSVTKLKDSYLYDLYRKDEQGNYIFIATHDFKTLQ